MKKIKIAHIITGLNMGGAEAMLYKLLKHMDKKKFKVIVISMIDEGVYGKKIKNLGIEVISLNMRRGKPTIKGFLIARNILKNIHIIQTWMYHADLFGYILCKFSKTKKLIWGIRRNNLSYELNKKSTIYTAKLNSVLSKNVDTIVTCSIKAYETHLNFGYCNKNMKIIPNGFEMDRFKSQEGDKEKLGVLINQPRNIPYILHVGRWNILKDHKNLLKSLEIIYMQNTKFHAILVGPNIHSQNFELIKLIKKHKLEKNVSLLGPRDDIPSIMSGADIFVSSSKDEGFPNVIGEAMACETPCVVTDAGDSAYIVGNTGIVVPPNDSLALAEGIIKMLSYTESEINKIGVLARQRVFEKFDIKKVSKQFEELYKLEEGV